MKNMAAPYAAAPPTPAITIAAVEACEAGVVWKLWDSLPKADPWSFDPEELVAADPAPVPLTEEPPVSVLLGIIEKLESI